MLKRVALIAAVALGVTARAAHADDELLNIGDPAPKLSVSKFVKGEKVETFEPGKTYIVEFWATWCGPCRATIPHLTKLAHQYKDKGVRVIGVDVFERDTSLVEPFLEEMGDKMDYIVALDDVPEGGNPNNGFMAKNWMDAAGENGIPTAFIIHDQKIAWIGHPIEMDTPLAKIVDGDWDLATHAAARLKAKKKELALARLRNKVYAPFSVQDWKGTLSALDASGLSDEELSDEFLVYKCAALCNSGDVDAGVKLGEAIYERNKRNPMALNSLAWYLVDPANKTTLEPPASRLALKAAQRAAELSNHSDFAILDTLAHAQFASGDAAAALATEEKAYKLLDEAVENKSHPYFKQFSDAIARFRAAADKDK